MQPITTDPRTRRVLLTGGYGFLGTHVRGVLHARGWTDVTAPTHAECDLRDPAQVATLFARVRPQIVIHLAAVVGGILANRERPAQFFYDNLMMGTVVQDMAHRVGAGKYLTCIGGCSYPSTAASPITEESLLQGYPQEESAPYALAKAMSVVQAGAYRQQYGLKSVILVPGNMYGPHDNFNLHDSHVIPALVRKFYEARLHGSPEVVVWGSGRPTRDFVYVGDVAEALVCALERYDGEEPINVSRGETIAIRALVDLVAELTGFAGTVVWDASKPDGQSEKVFDVRRMCELLDFECRTDLRQGLRRTIDWFSERYASGTIRL